MMNRMFGTVAFGVPLRLFPQWVEMLERHKKCSLFDRGGTLVALGGLTWEKFRNQTKDLPLMEKIKAVNSLWNRRPWKNDSTNWGLEDKWATPLEFCMKGGDCEDYAIAKMLSLKELGVDCPMRLVVGKKNGRGHAVLVIQIEDCLRVLDNTTDELLSDWQYKDFEPKDSMNELKAWTHLKKLS